MSPWVIALIVIGYIGVPVFLIGFTKRLHKKFPESQFWKTFYKLMCSGSMVIWPAYFLLLLSCTMGLGFVLLIELINGVTAGRGTEDVKKMIKEQL